jgi:CRISPR-associated protein Cas1
MKHGSRQKKRLHKKWEVVHPPGQQRRPGFAFYPCFIRVHPWLCLLLGPETRRTTTMHSLAITEQGTRVHAEGDTLLLYRGNELARRVRLAAIEQLLLFGRVEVTSAALALLARKEVDVVFLTLQGYFRARLVGRWSPAVRLRLRQLELARDPAFCLRLSRAMIAGKVQHQRQLLLRGQRRLADEELAGVLGQLRLLVEQCGRQTDLETLRGLEGRAAALYFGQFPKLLLTGDLAFDGRSRRPPRDPVNACLSFGYALLGRVVETEVLRSGLEPALGFFHQPHPGRPSLMLDLLEEFRPFVDGLVLRLVNRRQLTPLDFERHGGPSLAEILAEEDGGPAAEAPPAEVEGVYLGATGRRAFLGEFFKRLRERLYYPPRQGTFELRDIVREQVYHLARVLEGRDAEYTAFVPG